MAKQETPTPDTTDDAAVQAEMDELARRRAQAKNGEVDDGHGETPEQQLDREREKAAAEAAAQEEDDGQFALEIPEAKRKLNLGTIVPRGVPVELKYKMTGRAIPHVKGGLMDPADTTGLLLATRVVEEVQIKFTRDADLAIEKATVYVVVGARQVVNAHSEAGELLLRGDDQAA